MYTAPRFLQSFSLNYDVVFHTLQSPAPGKKGKASPAAKGKGSPTKSGKGEAPPTEAPPSETTAKSHVETPEQLAQRQRMGHLYKEHKAAIEKEGRATC